MDISYRGRLNKYFTGFGRYTWSHYESNTGGIGWFPQNQYAPTTSGPTPATTAASAWACMPCSIRKSLLNLAAGIFANTGSPWTELTGTDPYGDDLFNTRPDGVARNTETSPATSTSTCAGATISPSRPTRMRRRRSLGFSAGAFNVLNHVNGNRHRPGGNFELFGEVTSVAPPRRIQLAMRFEF